MTWAIFSGQFQPVTPKQPTVSLPAALTVALVIACTVVCGLVAMWVLL